MLASNEGNGKPTLWMVNQYAKAPDMAGGTRHYDFACELVKHGWDVVIFASDMDFTGCKHSRLGKGQLWHQEIIDGVRFVWIRAALYQQNDWRRILNMLSFTLNFLRVAPRINPAPQVIIGSSPHLFTPIGSWFAARRRKARFIVELRDLWPQALIDMTGLSEKRPSIWLMRFLEWLIYRMADKTIVLAKGSIGYLEQRGISEDRIVYIPNGVHMVNFAVKPDGSAGADRESWRNEFGFEGFTLVYTGAHGPANALHVILEAAEILQDQTCPVQFVLVGDGVLKADLIAYAGKKQLKNVRFMAPVPKLTVPRLLAAADAAVITLRSVDAFSYAISPNKLFDYMAAAKPIICAIPGDMADLIKESGAGYCVPPEDPQALAEAIKRLVSLPEPERDAMGKCGRSVVERDFSREKLAQRLIKALDA
jgi:glycosyltransferase involved in cell wall biosynthesis